MDAGLLIPSPDTLPAPGGLFNLLLILTFTLHIVLANAVVGAGAIGFLNRFRKGPGETAPELDRGLARRVAVGIALTVNLGVAPLLFLQVLYGQMIYVSSVLMAVFWVSLFILIIIAYYAVYASDLAYERLAENGKWLMGLAVAILLIVSYFFTRSLLLMINPGAWSGYFSNAAGTLMATGDASMLPRYLHFVAASAAFGGLAVAFWGAWRVKRGSMDGQGLVDQGMVWFGVATIVNFLLGAWYLGALPQDVLARTFSDSRLPAAYLMIGVVAGLASAPAAFAKHLGLTTVSALLSVLFMVLFRFEVREAYLAPYWNATSLPLSIQASPLVLFLVLLILGVFMVGYMLKLAMKSVKGGLR